MSVSQEILDWSQTRPVWQRDAMRRFVTHQSFSDADLDEVLALLKEANDLPVAQVIAPRPLEEKHLKQEGGAGGPVQLASLGDVENANRLAGGQRLSFALNGLTVVYGDNGSGKSGYVRILKQACRTRDAEAVLSNVFEPKADDPPSAQIRYRVLPAAEVTEARWTSGTEFDAALSEISVFDSRIATITIDKDSELAFLPFGLDVLEKLGDLCGRLKQRLTDEKNQLGVRIGDKRQGFGEEKGVLAELDKLTGKTTDAQVDALSAWSDADAQRLTAVNLMLSDPVNQAKNLRARRARCEQVRLRVDTGLNALSVEQVAVMRQKVQAVADAEVAKMLVSGETFANEPLQGVGSGPWGVMYASARQFSLEQAYPGREFPAAELGDRCVLCHQELDEGARKRLKRFEAFVRAEVEARARAAKRALKEAVEADATAKLFFAPAGLELENVHDGDAEWAATLMAVWEALTARWAAFGKAVETNEGWDALPPLPPFDAAAVSQHTAALETQALTHDAALEPAQKAALEAEWSRLKARKTFSENKALLLDLRGLLRNDIAYDKCLRAVSPIQVTTKKKELDEAHVQDGLRHALTDELKALRLTIPVNLGFSTRKAKSFHKVIVEGTAYSADIAKIISEGEFRALALACFLAQIRQSPHAGIVVDDPVSSLDHNRRDFVAERLVKEAANRQVIVFTHDLVFLYMLSRKAEESGISPAFISLRRTPETCGMIEDSVPWKAKKLKERLHHLEHTEIKALAAIPDETSDEYRRQAVSVADMLRKTWERLVEEVVLNGVVTRFDQDIRTKQLDGVDVTDEVVTKIWWEYKRVSNWAGHDEALPKNAPLPSPDDLRQQIEQMKDCQKQIEDRRAVVDPRRKEMRKPKQPEFA